MNWNFELIYKNQKEVDKDYNYIKDSIPLFAKFKGKLSDEASFVEYYLLENKFDFILSKLFSYQRMKYDLCMSDQNQLLEFNKVYSLYETYITEVSYVPSEILSIGKDKVMSFVKNNESIKNQQFGLEKLFRNNEHVLSSECELVMSYFNPPLNNYNKLYDNLAVADNSDKTVIGLSDGSCVEVNSSNYRSFLETLENQVDRGIVADHIFKFYDSHKNTFAGLYQGIIQSNIANAKARNYSNVLESFLFNNNIDTKVFTNLTSTTKANTGALKKYYELRKKHFKLDNIYTYDRFMPFAKSDTKFTYEESCKLFLDSVKPIGGEFYEFAQKVISEGFVDVNIKDAKRTGAYSGNISGVGPFILLNHSDTLNDCFTVAHEAGHSMHTMFSDKYQPYELSNYTIFVAEVASIFNEHLLLDHLMNNTNDDNLKIVMLQSAIDGLIGTYYRQTLFADYEYQAHNLVVENGSVTASSLSGIMNDLYNTYFGIDLSKENYKSSVWAYIPHFFHTPFYVYQYATSYAASMQIYNDVKSGKKDAMEKYINLLKAGGSKYPLDIVKSSGVDLTSIDPFLAVVKRMDELVSQLEKLLGGK